MIRFTSARGEIECAAGCGETAGFVLDGLMPPYSPEDVEDDAYDMAGWDPWGNCPSCARVRAAEILADAAMRDRKAGIEG